MKVGDLFRYGRPYDPEPQFVDELPNYFHATYCPGMPLPLLEKGINPIGTIKSQEGVRTPAILISSSPHKIGSKDTPWMDFFDPDNGHIRYYGDNKDPGIDPSSTPGNKALLNAFKDHSSPDKESRKRSVPILFFKRVTHRGKAKGHVTFQGFGIVGSVELVTQYDRKKRLPFSNYAFDFVVFSLAKENEEFDWGWINLRRQSDIELEVSKRHAPRSWRKWIGEGSKALETSRRRVSKLMTATREEQLPASKSAEEKTLQGIYEFYSVPPKRKSRFEALASIVAARVLRSSGATYLEGWVTPASSDGGSDFVGRLDLGSDFSKAKAVIIGQAKCERLDSATSGRDIARIVARLKRGWVGVYVTTGYFSEQVQREVIEDEYPIILIHGLRLATEVQTMVHEMGLRNLETLLQHVDDEYESKVQMRSPEEVIFI